MFKNQNGILDSTLQLCESALKARNFCVRMVHGWRNHALAPVFAAASLIRETIIQPLSEGYHADVVFEIWDAL